MAMSRDVTSATGSRESCWGLIWTSVKMLSYTRVFDVMCFLSVGMRTCGPASCNGEITVYVFNFDKIVNPGFLRPTLFVISFAHQHSIFSSPGVNPCCEAVFLQDYHRSPQNDPKPFYKTYLKVDHLRWKQRLKASPQALQKASK